MTVHRAYKAKDDGGLLGQISFIIFVAGFRYSLVEDRWPKITEAFEMFEPGKVKEYDETEVGRLMAADGMIKNKGKVLAVVENANLIHNIAERHGSAIGWVRKNAEEIRENGIPEEKGRELLAREFTRFKRIGRITSGWLGALYMSDKEYYEYEF